MSDTSIQPINVISASAGTGKTYRLSGEYLKGLSLLADDRGKNHQSAIMATTFTNKAADELIERVRRLLLEKGEWEAAQGVLSGYLGTVNSICGRLLTEHAIDAGLSPDLTVIAQERMPAVFAIAVDAVIHDFAEEMNEVATRLQIENWRKDVSQIIDAARNNNLPPSRLRSLAEESWSSLESVWKASSDGQAAADSNGEELDEALAAAIEAAIPRLKEIDDETLIKQNLNNSLADINRRLKSGNKLTWSQWAALAKLQHSKKTFEIVKPIIEAASKHDQHPRLRDDLRRTVYSVFECAAQAMEKYADYKKEHGLIDFVDQELLALQMLSKPGIRDSIKQNVRLLLVDEFQDTSPIQLAIFIELAKLVEYSVWVGDEKQSIFGFRGSDPELMRNAVKTLVTVTGGTHDKLAKSYRSRPTLVKFTNELFSRATQLANVTADSAIISEVNRPEIEGQNNALHVWWLDGKRRDKILSSLANGVRQVLSSAESWPVVDRETKQLRPIRGSDIVILCRTNSSRILAAKQLVAAGLTVATERDGLLDTPECALVFAALRVLVDKSDTLAVAEVVNYLSSDDGDWLNNVFDLGHNVGLDNWLRLMESEPAQDDQEGPAQNQAVALKATTANALQALQDLRGRMADRTPLEVLEAAINCEGIVESITSWGSVRQRLANLDSLRGVAQTYEEISRSARIPATTAGLVLYLKRFLEDGGLQPANPDENGIHVLTYHKAKGLEWPMVILYDLGGQQYHNATAFGITIESAEAELNALDPLSGRKIRYWPWPYGTHTTGLKLINRVGKTVEFKKAARRGTAENLRLLYVGITRARDYLIFSASSKSDGTQWLQQLTQCQSDLEISILQLPFQDEPYVGELIENVPESRANFKVQKQPDPGERRSDQEYVFLSPTPPEIATQESYLLKPSEADDLDVPIEIIGEPVTFILGERITLSGMPDMQVVGDCVHAFLTADRTAGGADYHKRLGLASALLKNYAVESIQPEALPVMADRINKFLQETFETGSLCAEVPVAGRLNRRRVRGSIDLLLETEKGFIIIDHKTFPGKMDEWNERALSYAPQLALYRHVVEQGTGKPVLAQFVHMPVVGAMIRLDCRLR